MGDYKRLTDIIKEIRRLRSFGMDDEEITVVLETDGVTTKFISKSFFYSTLN